MKKIITAKASAAIAPITIPAILPLERAGAGSGADGGVGKEDVGELLATVLECVVFNGELNDDDVDERNAVD